MFFAAGAYYQKNARQIPLLKYGLPAFFKFKRLYLRLSYISQCEVFVLHHLKLTTVDKILKNLDAAKAFGVDQIYAKDSTKK